MHAGGDGGGRGGGGGGASLCPSTQTSVKFPAFAKLNFATF